MILKALQADCVQIFNLKFHKTLLITRVNSLKNSALGAGGRRFESFHPDN